MASAETPSKIRRFESAGSSNEASTSPNQTQTKGGTITLVIDRMGPNLFKYFDKASPVHTIANLNWILHSQSKIMPPGNVDYLGLYLSYKPDQESSSYILWSGEVDVVIELKSQREGTENFIRSSNMVIDFYSKQGGFPRFIETSLLRSTSPYVKDNKLKIEAHIVLKTAIVRHVPMTDFASSKNQYADSVLVVEGVRLHISKQYLAMCSPVFAALFYSNFRERELNEVELKDVKLNEFTELLHAIYPSRKAPNGQTVEFLLKLGDKFDLPGVMKSCERFLILSLEITVQDKLVLGDKYQLSDLQYICIESFRSAEEINVLRQSNEYACLSSTTKGALLEKLAGLIR